MTVQPFEEPDLPVVYVIEEARFAPPLRFNRGMLLSLRMDLSCWTLVGLLDDTPAGFAIVSLHEEEVGAMDAWTIEVFERYRWRARSRFYESRLRVLRDRAKFMQS